MRIRKPIGSAAVLVVTLSLSAGPAYAESFHGWVKQTNSHYYQLAAKVAHDAKHVANAKTIRVFEKDLGSFVRYAQAHPAPGADRNGFIQVTNDLSAALSTLDAGNDDQAARDVTNAENVENGLPRPCLAGGRKARSNGAAPHYGRTLLANRWQPMPCSPRTRI